ncbi:NCS2 family permease [Desulfofundulus thermobenzoicus]|uniref:NCS2 family permease n=1 Tax=Desulfofundulus thermobenzoicus TaxID=29376 RepID=A0A6N7IVD4_9FIRM|nr:NCS2 family permease [Desulfofundulus thermobenzoicus]MQL53469.1 NCS2 family permease [Desulfofundulus thermobenzoicus]HHW44000.1 NCS2 family permease [Desulfotomaculum sp.]
MLEKIFKLRQYRTDARTEVIAGLTTFMTMAYILFLNPNILAGTGMDKNAVFFATAVAAGLVTIAMGLIVNYPIALAPGMGLNAYFAAVAAQHVGMPWPVALGAVFISGILFIILTITQIRQLLVVAVPNSMKRAIIVGIGLFITMLGLKMAEFMVIKAGPVIPPTLQALQQEGGIATLRFFEWNIFLGSFANRVTLLALIGLVISALLMARKVKGALLIGIILTTLIGIPLGVTQVPAGFTPFALPDFSRLAVGRLDLAGALHMGLWTVIFTFTFVELFDTFGTLVGTAGKAGLLDENGQSPRLGRAMLVDACGVAFGALMGTSTVTAYIESTAGIAEGGRTGLTAVTTGILFLIALVLAPVAGLIPGAATAPALIIVGLLMAQAVNGIDFEDFTEGLPAFLTMVLMPFTGSIANGIAAGIIFYVVLKLISGRAREVHWLMWILAVLVLARYLFLAEH